MKKIILTIIMGMFLLTAACCVVTAVENTDVTDSSFTTIMIELLMSFTIIIPIIIGFAILGFFMKGGSYYVNPWAVIIIGCLAILISIFLCPVVIKSISEVIFN